MSFFLGIAIATTHSRLIGGVLIAVPLAIFSLTVIRTPKSEWRKLGEVLAKLEHNRESRPVSGPLWWILHRFGDLVGLVGLALLVFLLGYSVYSWLR